MKHSFLVLLCAMCFPAIAYGAETAEQCFKKALPRTTFSIMTDEANNQLAAQIEADQADGKINVASDVYFATIAGLPAVSPKELGNMTFVIDRWFPLLHVEEAEPAIRIFLWQHPLQNADGIETNHAPEGPVVWMPKQGQAVPATEAAEAMALHVCNMRAEMHGAAEV